ncbi:uncharacterized protein LOC111085051 [Limulus polyphemus]|uniref:Uncharacterized protein LOC111085051 n=1 Tax=Limulus polyphemus TaxID=6850 RepID=A0ABM1S2F8_LIMPO|nr:uncharacterized protein LOC111085051 [Limulus polyphemus]XP_022237813.1 uncharacterized protein LOC111085051 [Limulus polyphemus]
MTDEAAMKTKTDKDSLLPEERDFSDIAASTPDSDLLVCQPVKKKKKKTFGKYNKALSLPQLNAIGQQDGRKGNLFSESVESVLLKKNSREEGWSVRLPTLNSETLISKIPPRPSTDETLEHFPAIATLLKH